MRKIVLISCVSKKRDYVCKARDLYVSELFVKSLEYAKRKLNADEIFILSAKYGLLSLDEVIAPYNKTLNDMNKDDRKKWSNLVIEQLEKHINIHEDEVIFLAGKKYREYIIPYIKNSIVPMEGLRIGQQLKFLKESIYD